MTLSKLMSLGKYVIVYYEQHKIKSPLTHMKKAGF